jgi:histone H3/H4
MARPKIESRPRRWQRAAGQAIAALEELQAIQEEYQDWLDNLTENLSGSALSDKLQTVCDLDIAGALDTVQEADSADLPLGFGRD